MAKNNHKINAVYGKLAMIQPQREQYKPYNFQITFENVIVELEVPEDGIISSNDQGVAINLDGFKAILSQVADAVEQVHDAYVIKARKAGKF